MEEFQFDLGSCGRCTKTFIQGPTAFVANIKGPVRAIRFEIICLISFLILKIINLWIIKLQFKGCFSTDLLSDHGLEQIVE